MKKDMCLFFYYAFLGCIGVVIFSITWFGIMCFYPIWNLIKKLKN